MHHLSLGAHLKSFQMGPRLSIWLITFISMEIRIESQNFYKMHLLLRGRLSNQRLGIAGNSATFNPKQNSLEKVKHLVFTKSSKLSWKGFFLPRNFISSNQYLNKKVTCKYFIFWALKLQYIWLFFFLTKMHERQN